MQPVFLDSQFCVSLTQNYASIDLVQETMNEQEMFFRKKGHELDLDNSVEKLYLCHITNFFPKEGIIKPRMVYHATEPLRSLFSVVRPTVHFTLNFLCQETEGFKFRDRKFAIIDRYQSSQDQIVGGYLEDVMCIGPYKLSKDAVILVPNSLKEDEQQQGEIKRLNGRIKEIIFYDDKEKKALEVAIKVFLKMNKAPIFQSIVDEGGDTSFRAKPNYLGQLDKGHFFSSKSFMESQGKIFCSHDITPMASLEIFLLRTEHVKLSKTSEKIKEYIEGITEGFPLQQRHRDFLSSYSKYVRLAMKIFIGTKGNEKALSVNWKKFGDSILLHDQLLIEKMHAVEENKDDT